jgi:hypothetical protein
VRLRATVAAVTVGLLAVAPAGSFAQECATVATSNVQQSTEMTARGADARATAATNQQKPAPQRKAKPKKLPWMPAAGSVYRAGFVSLNGGRRTTTAGFSDAYTYEAYAEQASVGVAYPVNSAAALDMALGIRVFRNLTFGAAVSRYDYAGTAAISGSIPHPFYFDRLRPVEGSEGATRSETAFHLQGMWTFPIGRKVLLAVGGGPTRFSARQDMVTKVDIAETYPYDTAPLGTVFSARQYRTTWGFNVAADLMYMLKPRLGVGGLVRFSKGSTQVDGLNNLPVSLKLGGAQLLGGIRFRL